MSIGEKNRKIGIYKPDTAVDTANESAGWIFVKDKWAEIKTQTGMARVNSAASAGGINTSLVLYSFRVNYDRSIDTTMQIRDPEGNCYNVVNVLHDAARRVDTYLVAELGGANG